ncbi:F0F1 ATP synthase subunit delta [Amphibacillus sp. MSJ-3]|uniref:F0F1 ATP synthase subunit delta n=1 Tax=Amphibacillus sp. MSJ-3 TaxID=2841505 RepID=UPI001C0F2F2E|nr:F0F1 ATP synthase subunit delta [Amphibacillus sp. MSJ-3]MBU5594869.1 F0F1 ATP synthase subunit delta [Amphibacillus sp. MSJ-3]
MRNRLQARRYAEALYEIARENGREEAIGEELKIIQEVFTADSELVTFLQNPTNWLKRAQIIESVFKSFSTEVVKTLLIMVEHHAEENVELMVDHYQVLFNQDRQIATGEIFTVEPLAQEELADIEIRFAEKFGCQNLKLNNVTDPNVLGGFKIIVNQQLYDASVQGRIQHMKRDFVPMNKR